MSLNAFADFTPILAAVTMNARKLGLYLVDG